MKSKGQADDNYSQKASIQHSNRRPQKSGKKYTAVDLLAMNDFDFDELLDCADDNIETTAFFASSTQVLSILDSTIAAIDERLSKKRS